MRQDRTVQASLFDRFAQHEIGGELKKASTWLDEHPALLGLVAADLRRDGVQETGRHGLPAEAVLRCALLKQYRQLSYEELAFHLEDSASFRAFARLPWAWSVEPEEIGAAQDDQRDPPRNLGADQSHAADARAKRSSSAAGWCGSTARPPRHRSTSRATAACCGTRCG